MPTPISDLFREEPFRWGLRGDPWLWREMRERFAGVPCPDTVDELVAAIEAMFRRLTGRPASEPEPFYVEGYSHGGMSSGMVSARFWRETAIPLLRQRYLDETNDRLR